MIAITPCNSCGAAHQVENYNWEERDICDGCYTKTIQTARHEARNFV